MSELIALRPDDLLALRVSWLHLQIKDGMLIREPGAKDAFIIIEFEPQHIAEEAYFEKDNNFPVKKPDKDANTNIEKLPKFGEIVTKRVAGRSRLAFRLPVEIDSIPCTIESILNACSKFPLSLIGTAATPPLPIKKFKGAESVDPNIQYIQQMQILKDPREPSPEQTAIEAPWQLILSPNELCAWIHSISPVIKNKDGKRFVELWHTRLGTRPASGPTDKIFDGCYTYIVGDNMEWHVEHIVIPDYIRLSPEYNRTVRAIWSFDYLKRGLHTNYPFRMSLDTDDRRQLVNLTGNPKINNWRSRVVNVRRLMLSSLGAWIDIDYAANPLGTGQSIESWRHQAILGRDQYVRVINVGKLCGSCARHTAALVKVTERKFQRRIGAISDEAFLRQRVYLVVREPEIEFDTNRRQMPFRRVRLTTLVTPNLDDPNSDGSMIKNPKGGIFGDEAFWPHVQEKPFLFHVIAWDWDGQRSEFTTPLYFVNEVICNKEDDMINIRNDYNSNTRKQWRNISFMGQNIAFAESGDKPGSTTLEVTNIEFAANPRNPNFEPIVINANVHIPAVKQLMGSTEPIKIKIDDEYVNYGWSETNKGEVFACIPDGLLMKFGANQSGGIATPNMNVGGISRRFGQVGGTPENVKKFNNGTFTPSDFFSHAKILGGIDLAEIIEPLLEENTVPKLTTRIDGSIDSPNAIITELFWEPVIKKDGFGAFKPGDFAKLSLRATITKFINTITNDPKSETVVEGYLNDFKLNLLGFIILHFNSLYFCTRPKQKTQVKADIKDVTFNGPLAFVKELQKYIGNNGSNDSSAIDVSSDGVRVGYTLELPSIAVGVMTLQNISFSALLTLPFTDDPVQFRFAFSERDRPFQLTIYVFGGGGFFSIALGPDGVEQMEAALEFGAAISINIGVASGGIHLMAGIYYSWNENGALLEGYLRMGGELDVLGLVSLSLEFIMCLAYDIKKGVVWGEATLIVEIEVLCFSDSVEMSVRREFGDPPRLYFQDMISVNDWNNYWNAFALK